MTFRLADSLPKTVLLNFEREKAERLRRLRHIKSRREAVNDSEEEIARDLARKIERYLDQGCGRLLPTPARHCRCRGQCNAALPPKPLSAARVGCHAESRSRHRLADAESFAK